MEDFEDLDTVYETGSGSVDIDTDIGPETPGMYDSSYDDGPSPV